MQTNVLEYLEQTAPQVPEKLAFSNGTEGMTFREVYDQARAIGSTLLSLGAEREAVVVFMEKHPRTVTAFFGAVYAGCFYVPIDAEMPRFRVELILQQLKPRFVLCDDKTRPLAEELKGEARLLSYEEAASGPIDPAALAAVRDSALDTDPIYIVFTSGSTGVPKGVAACHRSVIDYIEQLSRVLGFSRETVFGNQTPLYFDACLKELYPTLKFGATTYLIPKSLFMFPVKLVEYLNEHRINTICWVVSALTMISGFKVLEKHVPQYLHTVAFGSEMFPIRQLKLWRAALPSARFVNLYGPTEATGMSCWFEVDRDFSDDEILPVGRPFRNTGVLLLDEQGRPAAPGQVGEICLRGTCLTLGYYGDFARTHEAFVQNPLNDKYPELIYRTGDLGRYNERGELVFLSRKDNQIKHVGHRIELGEVEVVACMDEAVRAACCLYDGEKKRLLLCYEGEAEPAELAKSLRAKLPPYMAPNGIHRLEALPRTPNGKMDRRALLERARNGTL
ncbi:MAG TPA: amino acid adenylation domain-containing protein [Candidatus Galloscillospira excrementavium]|nr:amino acid adenylation domain-containing protein [Candidatus Galloscillospira excrementavium]